MIVPLPHRVTRRGGPDVRPHRYCKMTLVRAYSPLLRKSRRGGDYHLVNSWCTFRLEAKNE